MALIISSRSGLMPDSAQDPSASAQLSLDFRPSQAPTTSAAPLRSAALVQDEAAPTWSQGLLTTASTLGDAQDDPVVISIAATADAVGEATFASVTARLTVVDRGMITLAFGAVSLAAHATAAEGAPVYAATQCTADILGADLVLSATQSATGGGSDGQTAWASSVSTTRFLALDIVGCQLGGGSILLESTLTSTLSGPPPALSGNVASFDVRSQVFSGDSLNAVTADAIAVEGAFSSATTSVLVATDMAPPGTLDRFLIGSIFSDRMTLGAGDDWVIAGFGNDAVDGGGGHNTLFGNAGNDRLMSAAGNDWGFGGIGNDTLQLGEGDNLAYGGAGNDHIICGSGADAIKAGLGNDTVHAGGGNNSILMGAPNGDGNDSFVGGSGADWYFLNGAFGTDVIAGLNLAQGDRLVFATGDWDTEAGLAALNGTSITLTRAATNPHDLLVTMPLDGLRARVTLDDFFVINADFATNPARGVLGDAAAVPLLLALFVDADTDAEAAQRLAPFDAGDLLSPLG